MVMDIPMQETHSPKMVHNGQTKMVTIMATTLMEMTLTHSHTIRLSGKTLMETAMVTGQFRPTAICSQMTLHNGVTWITMVSETI